MPPRARKSQPKSLQYRPKAAQHLPEEPMSPKSTQCHPKAAQCPQNLRSLLQVEAADPSGVGCGRGVQRPTYTNAERQPQGTVVRRWSGKRGSDPRPQPWQGCALPTELFPQYNPVPRGWDYKGTEFFFDLQIIFKLFCASLLKSCGVWFRRLCSLPQSCCPYVFYLQGFPLQAG